MKALLCREFGPEANMNVEEIDAPELKPGHVLVDVKAGGLNFPDLLCVRGQYQFKPELPFVPGTEGAGVIRELGEGVASLKAILGDELPDHHAAHLLNLADMDISLAVAMFFDGNDGRAPAAPSPARPPEAGSRCRAHGAGYLKAPAAPARPAALTAGDR